MKSFYARMLLWFCAANVLTLLISVGVTEKLVRVAYGSEPDWASLASAANETYIKGGTQALRRWQEEQHQDRLDGWLFEAGRNLSEPRLPTQMMQDLLPQLLAGDNVVLHPRPELFIASLRVAGSDGIPRQFVVERMPRPREQLRQLLLIQVTLTLSVIGIVGWFLARGIARPVRALSTATRQMADGELQARVEDRWTRGSDEIGALARDFNTMAGRIEALVEHERGVLQDISHELRSPLARLQLHLELARRAAPGPLPQLERADHEIARLDRLLTEILALTRLEAGLPGMTREPCDLAELLRDRLDEACTDYGGRLVAELYAPGPVWVSGSPPLLERAFDNLVGNAIKYGHAADTEQARVEVTVRCVDGKAVLGVRDHGPGIVEAELPMLFRPFFRGANSTHSHGQGLGLAVVMRIAAAHDGEVSATNAEGGGLQVELRLPLAPAGEEPIRA